MKLNNFMVLQGCARQCFPIWDWDFWNVVFNLRLRLILLEAWFQIEDRYWDFKHLDLKFDTDTKFWDWDQKFFILVSTFETVNSFFSSSNFETETKIWTKYETGFILIYTSVSHFYSLLDLSKVSNNGVYNIVIFCRLIN